MAHRAVDGHLAPNLRQRDVLQLRPQVTLQGHDQTGAAVLGAVHRAEPGDADAAGDVKVAQAEPAAGGEGGASATATVGSLASAAAPTRRRGGGDGAAASPEAETSGAPGSQFIDPGTRSVHAGRGERWPPPPDAPWVNTSASVPALSRLSNIESNIALAFGSCGGEGEGEGGGGGASTRAAATVEGRGGGGGGEEAKRGRAN